MHRRKLISILISINIFLFSNAAHAAITIDFQSLESPGNGIPQIGSSYSESGFAFTGLAVGGLCPGCYPILSYIQTGHPGYPGSTGLHNGGATIEMTKQDGGTFDLVSADITNGIFNILNQPIPFQISATKADGTTVVKLVNQVADRVTRTVTFDASFTNLRSVRWQEGAIWFQIDNIVIANASGNIPPPIPPSPSVSLDILNAPNSTGQIVVTEHDEIEVQFSVSDPSGGTNDKDIFRLIAKDRSVVVSKKKRGAQFDGTVSLKYKDDKYQGDMVVQYVHNDQATGTSEVLATAPDPQSLPILGVSDPFTASLLARLTAIENQLTQPGVPGPQGPQGQAGPPGPTGPQGSPGITPLEISNINANVAANAALIQQNKTNNSQNAMDIAQVSANANSNASRILDNNLSITTNASAIQGLTSSLASKSGAVRVLSSGQPIGLYLDARQLGVTGPKFDRWNQMAVLSSTNYIFMVNPNGTIPNSLDGLTYWISYDQNNCGGKGYIGEATPNLRIHEQGWVLNAPDQSALYYVPKGSAPIPSVQTLSRREQGSGCRSFFAVTANAIPVFPNDPNVTGVPSSQFQAPITIGQ